MAFENDSSLNPNKIGKGFKFLHGEKEYKFFLHFHSYLYVFYKLKIILKKTQIIEVINRKYFHNAFEVNINNNSLLQKNKNNNGLNIFHKQNQQLSKEIMIIIC